MLVWVNENMGFVHQKVFGSDQFGTPKYFKRIGDAGIFMVYEEYTFANGNYMTSSIVLETFENGTLIHFVQGGSARGIFGFDWGSGRRREQRLISILKEINMEYKIVEE